MYATPSGNVASIARPSRMRGPIRSRGCDGRVKSRKAAQKRTPPATSTTFRPRRSESAPTGNEPASLVAPTVPARMPTVSCEPPRCRTKSENVGATIPHTRSAAKMKSEMSTTSRRAIRRVLDSRNAAVSDCARMAAMRTTPPVRVSVVGGGSIGVGWAIVFARAAFDVKLYDPDPERLEAAPRELRARLDDLARFGLLRDAPGEVAARVGSTGDLATAVEGAAYVQECAPEDLELKRALLATLDDLAPRDAAVASSSSAIPISESAGELALRERFLVAHPGNPPYLLPVVELVPAPFTRADVVFRAAELLERAGMSVVQLRKEIDGFVFNRLQSAVLREAYRLVRDGVATVDDVDRVVRDGVGRRWAVIGPFETADLNTRGGIAAHAARLGPAYARMGAERGEDDPFAPQLVARVAAERRELLPLERWEERVAWRDRMLMQQERARGDADDPVRAADRVEITSLLHRYCRMLDRMDLDVVPQLFVDDCLVVYGPDER